MLLVGNAQPSLEHLHSSLLLQSFETWLESKLQQIGVHPAMQNTLIFMGWHDEKRSSISIFWGGFFFRLGGGRRFVFFIYGTVFLTGVCIFQRIYLLCTNSGLFIQSFQEKICRWNKLPFNLSFTVVSCKWRNGSLCEPSKLWNKCTMSCIKVLKPISTHFRIIMYFKSICWNINTIMWKEINAQYEVSLRSHKIFCSTRLN